jgi:hypothetical protein
MAIILSIRKDKDYLPKIYGFTHWHRSCLLGFGEIRMAHERQFTASNKENASLHSFQLREKKLRRLIRKLWACRSDGLENQFIAEQADV